MFRLLSAASVLAVVGLQACYNCTMMGCFDALTVNLVAPDGFVPGAYTVALVGDTEATCAFTVLGPDDCDGAAWCMDVGAECGAWQDGDGVQLAVDSIEGVVVVSVDRDGVTVAEDDFSPVYEEYTVNGPHCGPTCRSAAVELSL